MTKRLLLLLCALLLSDGFGAEIGHWEFSSNAIEMNGIIVEVITNHTATNRDDTPAGVSFTTPAYSKEAFRLVLQEANEVARDLRLPERLPITEGDVVESFIAPYGYTQHRTGIGNIRTRDYQYSVSVGYKMSYVEGTHQDQDCLKWIKEYQWPKIRVDTNMAYQLATQWLAAANMDVKSLNRDCQIRSEPERYWNAANPKSRTTFIPIYEVHWVSERNRLDGYGDVASIKLFAPTKTLVSLRVEDSKYILREPLVFTNLDALLARLARN